MTKKIQVSASIDPDLKARIETLAKSERRSMSGMIEILLEKALQDRETHHVSQEEKKRGEEK